MSYYRPRPLEARLCLHCGHSFPTNHKRTRYCAESCRQLAYQARRKTSQPSPPTETPAGDASQLSFSLHNMGVSGAGAAVVALTNYLINDRPAQQAILAQIAHLSQRVDQLTKASGADLPPVSGESTQPPPSTASPRPSSVWFNNKEPTNLDELCDHIAWSKRQPSP